MKMLLNETMGYCRQTLLAQDAKARQEVQSVVGSFVIPVAAVVPESAVELMSLVLVTA
jgi:hypothetical protein